MRPRCAYLEPRQRSPFAERRQAYVIWGALAFLKFKDRNRSAMEILVSGDPILPRVMASVIVNPDKVEGVNVKGAEALQEYPLAPPNPGKNCGLPVAGKRRAIVVARRTAQLSRAPVRVFDTGPPKWCSRSPPASPWTSCAAAVRQRGGGRSG